MTKTSPLGVRLSNQVLDALRLIAVRSHRTPSGLARMVLVQWLEENGENTRVDSNDDRMTEALRRIATWPQAYPLEVFPEPDESSYTKAREVLKANGLTLEMFTIAAMRHVIVRVGEIARAGRSPAE